MVRNGTDAIRPQAVVDGLRTGNSWSVNGQLIDRLSFVACSSYPGFGARTNASVEQLARNAAFKGTDTTGIAGCATMGQKLQVRPGADIVVAVFVRDPVGTNYTGQWPANTNWMSLSGNVVAGGLSAVPAGAKNTSTRTVHKHCAKHQQPEHPLHSRWNQRSHGYNDLRLRSAEDRRLPEPSADPRGCDDTQRRQRPGRYQDGSV